jgi:hypothetical protein
MRDGFYRPAINCMPRELSFAAQETASHAQAEPIMCEAVQCLKDDE